MGIYIKNANTSVGLSLTALKLVGFWAPDGLSGNERTLYNCYSVFSFMFLLGIYIIIQVVDLILVWGNLPLMTGTAFLLFTNLAQLAKIVNIVTKRQFIQKIIDDANRALTDVRSQKAKEIVKSCSRETRFQQLSYLVLTVFTATGWATSAEKNQLPLRAWYPYDTSKSPAFEMTYIHQVTALFIAATLNVGKDSLVTSLIAQCRCRLQLLSLSLRTLCQDMKVSDKLTTEQEMIVKKRLRKCVSEHQRALQAVQDLQTCFSAPTFAQFTVSLIIICVTAFQLTSLTGNIVRLVSMATYLLNMCYQVFIYCYQGSQLSEESSDVARAAYQCPWYWWGAGLRRCLLVVMVRARRVASLTAGGFTTLSLTTFMAIIKASYSLFTVLQQVVETK